MPPLLKRDIEAARWQIWSVLLLWSVIPLFGAIFSILASARPGEPWPKHYDLAHSMGVDACYACLAVLLMRLGQKELSHYGLGRFEWKPDLGAALGIVVGLFIAGFISGNIVNAGLYQSGVSTEVIYGLDGVPTVPRPETQDGVFVGVQSSTPLRFVEPVEPTPIEEKLLLFPLALIASVASAAAYSMACVGLLLHALRDIGLKPAMAVFILATTFALPEISGGLSQVSLRLMFGVIMAVSVLITGRIWASLIAGTVNLMVFYSIQL